MFVRGFQPELWTTVKNRLSIKFPDHYPDDPYPLSDINDAAKFILHGSTPSVLLSQPAYGAQSSPPSNIQSTSSPSIKVKDLSTFFDKFTATLIKALAPQQQQRSFANGSQSQPQSYPRDAIPPNRCFFCGEHGHYGANCPISVQYLNEGKIQHNQEGKVVLPSGAYVPRSIPGITLRDRVDKYHKRNPNQTSTSRVSSNTNTSSQLMYEVLRPPPASFSIAKLHDIKYVGQTSTNEQQNTSEYIATLEKQILALRRKQAFDGVEIPTTRSQQKRPAPPQRNATPGPSNLSSDTAESYPSQSSESTRPTIIRTPENTAPIAVHTHIPPIHPFSNVK
jgi:hypothetical protein